MYHLLIFIYILKTYDKKHVTIEHKFVLFFYLNEYDYIMSMINIYSDGVQIL